MEPGLCPGSELEVPAQPRARGPDRAAPAAGAPAAAGTQLEHRGLTRREAGQDRVPDGAEHLEPLALEAGIWQQQEEAAVERGNVSV